ncbi:MAG: NUDIX domain-containing protein [Lutispora sp.]|nr:NUDIX domain-containing protein [Lutispora sp.]
MYKYNFAYFGLILLDELKIIYLWREEKVMKCEVYKLNYLKDYKYVVVIAKYHGKWVLCKHKKRDTWETAGGHIELEESPLNAAKRELFEETGAVSFDIKPIFDYWAADETSEANGMVFYAEIGELDNLPESEMEKVKCFETLPSNLTYKDITPKLFEYLENNFQYIFSA